MKQTRWLMGMPITVELVDPSAMQHHLDIVWRWFREVDERFSTYKPESEISRLNTGRLMLNEASPDVTTVLQLAEQTKQVTDDFFDVTQDGRIDPSGIVKGWAIEQAAGQLRRLGLQNFSINAGGDVSVDGLNSAGQPWRIGIRHPRQPGRTVKVVQLSHGGLATSGTYFRGQHIYNPHRPGQTIDDIVSLTVVAGTVYDADRFATAAFAMGQAGIAWLETQPGLEGYMITADGRAILTSGFDRYVVSYALAR